jgi:PiT family inorganic phosphate transporter
MFILILVVVTAVCFDFTNGFHDTANAVATSIATGALKPRVAVLMAAVLNLVGAFLSIKVAATIAKGIVDPKALQNGSGLHALIGGVIGERSSGTSSPGRARRWRPAWRAPSTASSRA